MKPVNCKSLFTMICDQIDKLDNNEIDVEKAKAQSQLFKQANNLLKYELDRANTLMKLADYNSNAKNEISLREIESKNFDNTI
jgi:hypothetical protein